MSPFKDILNNHGFLLDKFFILSSEHDFSKVNSHLFGYAFFENKLYIDEEINKLLTNDAPGAWVNIVVQSDKIVIQQDFNASFGLYVFRRNDYWAISNSLYLLAKYLGVGGRKYKLSLNN